MAHTTREETPDLPRPGRPPHAEPPPPGGPAGSGCLYALSQPPLMLFLTVIGALLLIAGAHDQFLL